MSTNVGLCASTSRVWILLLHILLLHTISTLWGEASFSLTLWSAKCCLDHYQYAMSIFPESFFWHLVINGQFMLIVQIPGLGRLWFDGLFQMSSLAIRDMVLCTLLSNLPWKLSFVFDRRSDETLISSIKLVLNKKLHQVFVHLIFLYLSLFLSLYLRCPLLLRK